VVTLARIALGTVGVLGAAALLVVVLGTFVPRIPVIGFFGSFVSGQYPVHVDGGHARRPVRRRHPRAHDDRGARGRPGA
jgi:hypothetical protein